MIISITGFMGAGKTELANRITKKFGAKKIDLDSEIERGEQKTISTIFEDNGESYFRILEESYLNRIISEAGSKFGNYNSESDIKLCFNSEEELLSYLQDNWDLSNTLVISLGGGTLNNPSLLKLIKENTLCIYLNTDLRRIQERLAEDHGNRPLLKNENSISLPEKIEDLYAERVHIYEDAAEIILNS